VGVWGAGLSSGDFAMDLRSTVRAVARLPFESGQLIEILCEQEPPPSDEQHSRFWLVIADQFAKRGIASDRVREKALGIIDRGEDLAMLEKLGMGASDLKKRRKMLEELRARVAAPAAAGKPRTVLKKRQDLLMSVGEVFVYPTCAGRCRNPYFASKEDDRYGTASAAWEQDGWSAMVIVNCGRAFEFLSWYRPLTVAMATAEKPTWESLRRSEVLWRLTRPGTSTPLHFQRMEFEKIGTWAIDQEKLRPAFPGMKPGTSAAVDDISLANGLNVGPQVAPELMPRPGEPLSHKWGRPCPTIFGIEQILSA